MSDSQDAKRPVDVRRREATPRAPVAPRGRRPRETADDRPAAAPLDAGLVVLGQRVRIYRLRRRQVHSGRPWTQEDLAVAIGSDKAHVNRIECGRQRPTRDTLTRMCDALALPWAERRRLLSLSGYLVAPPAPDMEEIAETARRVGGAVHAIRYPACLVDHKQRIWDVNELFAVVVLGYGNRDACLTDVRGRHTVELLCAKRRAGVWLREVLDDFPSFARRNLMMLQRSLQQAERATAADEGLLNDVLEDGDLCALWLNLSAHLPAVEEPAYLDHQSVRIRVPQLPNGADLEVWHGVVAADERFRVIHFVPANDRTRDDIAGLLHGHEAARSDADKTRIAMARVQTPAVFPQRPVTLTVPWAAGGSTDVCARILAPLLAKELGQPVVVENREGHQSFAELKRVAALPNDGHNLTFINQPAFDTISATQPGGLAIAETFRLIANQAYDPMGVFVRADSRYVSLRDLVRDMSRRPTPLSVGTSGALTPSHLAALMLQQSTQLRFAVNHYRGSAEHVARFLAGQTDVAFLGSGLSLPAIRAGELRALAMFTDKRFPLLPDAPTAAEEGFPGLVLVSTRGLWVRADTPGDIFLALEAAVLAALRSATHQRLMHASGFDVRIMNAVEYEGYAQKCRCVLAALLGDARQDAPPLE